MSYEVDKYLLEEMKKDDDANDMFLMLETDIHHSVLDHLCGWDEETGTFDSSQGLLFPQPIHTIK